MKEEKQGKTRHDCESNGETNTTLQDWTRRTQELDKENATKKRENHRTREGHKDKKQDHNPDKSEIRQRQDARQI